MNTTWDQLRSRLKELVNPDDSGDREAAEATGGERSEPAILSKEQRGAITHIVNHFHAAIAGMLGSTLRDAAEEARIKQWLDQKYDRLERALHSGEALHFDVLLLGIVSLVRHARFIGLTESLLQVPIHLGLVLHNIVRAQLMHLAESSEELLIQSKHARSSADLPRQTRLSAPARMRWTPTRRFTPSAGKQVTEPTWNVSSTP